MASATILQNLIARLGQSQDDRHPRELAPDFVRIDERSGADLLAQARALAGKLHHYPHDPELPGGDWRGFFPEGDDAALLARDDGSVPPHLGLFGAFLKLYEYPQAALNGLGARHLDFQYRRVLGFVPRPAAADYAHLVCELKKGAAPFAIGPAQRFSAGKDEAGREWFYRPLRETVINHARVAALHSVHRDGGGLHFAPVAHSADGLGGVPDPARPQWRAFGHAGLPLAPVGCALASSLFRLQEGLRRIELDLELAGLDAVGLDATGLAASLHAYVSGAEGWLGPYALGGKRAGNVLTLDFAVAAGEPAVVDYDPAIHGLAFVPGLPVVQLLLRPESAARYAALAALRPGRLAARVAVTGMSGLALENDNGPLNPKKAFLPFGPQPVKGARFMVGCPEALGKRLLDLKLRLAWQAAPANLHAWYVDYKRRSAMQNGVSARLVYTDAGGGRTETSLDLMARDSSGASVLSPSAPPPASSAKDGDDYRFALLRGGSSFSRWLGKRFGMARPMYQREAVAPPPARSGFVTVGLDDDFLHADYRREAVEHAVKNDKIVLNEPYTPTVQQISLDYRATTATVDVGATGEADFVAAGELQFFHVGAFGQRREHGFLRRSLAWADGQAIGLLPAYPDEGEFLIGLSGIGAGEAASLLLQVAEGSADPDLQARPVRWSVLCDNHWRPVAADELALDTTRALRASGLVGIVLSRWTTTDNSWLPPGRVWLKAAIAEGSAAACQLLAVASNGIEVACELPPEAERPAHVVAPGSIACLLDAPAGVKQVAQPQASFGGRAREGDEALRRRAAERLRHRQRCLTAWDYERLLLEAFPEVHRIKCIPHASDTSWMAPGNVLLVAIPDLRNRNALDPLRPKVDLDTLTRMREIAAAHAPPQVTVRVRNPAYQAVRLDFKVRFVAGLPFDYTRQQLHAAIVQALSPWAFEAGRQLQFGGRLYRSVLLDFIEELPYVDFVTDFRFGLAGSGASLLADVPDIVADRPDAILVSAASHVIGEVSD
nr:baseplate J/gp47 family protein [Dechloromonas sp.]